jgi:hypothetical protein
LLTFSSVHSLLQSPPHAATSPSFKALLTEPIVMAPKGEAAGLQTTACLDGLQVFAWRRGQRVGARCA